MYNICTMSMSKHKMICFALLSSFLKPQRSSDTLRCMVETNTRIYYAVFIVGYNVECLRVQKYIGYVHCTERAIKNLENVSNHLCLVYFILILLYSMFIVQSKCLCNVFIGIRISLYCYSLSIYVSIYFI